MTPRVPLVSSKKALSAFKRLGFEEAHREGSHVTLVRERAGGGKDITVLPDAKHEIPRWTMESALELAGVGVEEFTSALRRSALAVMVWRGGSCLRVDGLIDYCVHIGSELLGVSHGRASHRLAQEISAHDSAPHWRHAIHG